MSSTPKFSIASIGGGDDSASDDPTVGSTALVSSSSAALAVTTSATAAVSKRGLDPEALQRFIDDPDSFIPNELTLEQANLTTFEDDTLLNYCIRREKTRAVQQLLELGVDSNAFTKEKGLAPLAAAAHKGFVPIMNLLIKHGASINAVLPYQSSSTPLIQASHFNHINAVELLLKHGAQVDFANVRGTTALMRSSQEGNLAISHTLIKSKADVNKKNLEGMSALMLASQRGHGDMAELLIRAGAQIDDQTSQGSTALMLACKRGNLKCVVVLVRMGAEVYIRDCKGRNAKETAIRKSHEELLPYLDSQEQIKLIRVQNAEVRNLYLNRLLLSSSRASKINESEANILDILDDIRVAHTLPSIATAAFSSSLLVDRRPQCLRPVSRVYSESEDSIRCTSDSTTNAFEWPKVLEKCRAILPPEICELVLDYIPLPRMWHWSLKKLKLRCKVSPQHAIRDICVIADELIADSNIFRGQVQKNLLVKVSQSPDTHKYLAEDYGMSLDLLSKLAAWSDLQSIACRISPLDVAFSSKVAKDFLKVICCLYEWFASNNNAGKALQRHIMQTKDKVGGRSSDASSSSDVDALAEKMRTFKLRDVIGMGAVDNISEDSDEVNDSDLNQNRGNHPNNQSANDDDSN